MATQHATFCRFCHAFCSILVDVEDGRARKIVGNKNNDMYHGYTCVKGRALPEQHYHPERLLQSQKRVAPGRYVPIPAEQAMDEIAAGLKAIMDAHGPRAVALYAGTFSYHYPSASALSSAFMRAIGSPMTFSPSSIDQPGKPLAVAFHGRWSGGPQTFDDADTWMLVGTNPLISKWGGIPQFNPARHLHEAKKRGIKLISIDPRRTECAEKSDIHIQPKPGEDPTILAGMARLLIEEALYDKAFVDAETEGFDALKAALAPFTPDYVERRAKVPAAQLIEATRMFAAGRRGRVTCGTGPNMAPRGTMTEYLVLVINTLCGRWMREGEALPNPHVLLPQAEGKAQAEARPDKAWGYGEQMRVRGLSESAAGLPTAAAAEEILTEGEGRVRALISMGGNPMAAWPDQLRTYEALQKLELGVAVDIKMSATAKLSDYVIAPKLSLEAPSTTLPAEALTFYGVSPGYPRPYAQYAPKVVEPPRGADVIEEWEFFYGLGQRLGLQLEINKQPLDMVNKPTSDAILALMCTGSRVPLDEVKQHPFGHIFTDPSILVKPKDEGWAYLLHIGHPEMVDELGEIAAEPFFEHAGYAANEVFTHRMISRRMNDVYNSNGRDIANLTRNYSYNPAFMNPADIEALGLKAGDVIEITSERATIYGIVEEAPDVRAGAISMAHAWGDAPTEDDKVWYIGSNTGRLTDNTTRFDKRSGIPIMSAIPVNVRKSAAFDDTRAAAE